MRYLLLLSLLLSLLRPALSDAARGFGTTDGSATTDQITLAYTTHPTSWSLSIWFYRTGTGGSDFGRIVGKGNGTAGLRFFENVVGGPNLYNLASPWTTEGQWTIAAPSSSAWHHALITYDGSSTANNPIIYIDGSSVTVTRLTAPVGSLVTNSDGFILGNRSDQIRNFNGRLAEFAFWNGSILTAGNATSLAAGARADSIGSPVAYLKLCGSTSPEPNEISGGATGTVTGALVQTHPFSNCSTATSLNLLMGVSK
jgi:hypothetical protein